MGVASRNSTFSTFSFSVASTALGQLLGLISRVLPSQCPPALRRRWPTPLNRDCPTLEESDETALHAHSSWFLPASDIEEAAGHEQAEQEDEEEQDLVAPGSMKEGDRDWAAFNREMKSNARSS